MTLSIRTANTEYLIFNLRNNSFLPVKNEVIHLVR